MTEIPDDVMKAAYDAALDCRNDKACDPIHNDDALQLAFARAILAERERCAAVAERFRNEWAADSDLWVKHGMHALAKKSEEMSKGAALVADYINNI